MDFNCIKNYILNHCYDFLTKKEILRYWFFTALFFALYFLLSYPFLYTSSIFIGVIFLCFLFAFTAWSAVLLISEKTRKSIKMHAMYVACMAILFTLLSLAFLVQTITSSEYSVLLILPILILSIAAGFIAIIRIKQNVSASQVSNKSDVDSAATGRKSIAVTTIGAVGGALAIVIMTALPTTQDMYQNIIFYVAVIINAFFSFCSCIHLYRLYLIKKYCPQIDDYS